MEMFIDAVSANQPTKDYSGYLRQGPGFQIQLIEALNAFDKKTASKAEAESDKRLYQITSSVDQLVHQGTKQSNICFASDRLSSGMLNLYIAQEKKDEKSGRGREISPVRPV